MIFCVLSVIAAPCGAATAGVNRCDQTGAAAAGFRICLSISPTLALSECFTVDADQVRGILGGVIRLFKHYIPYAVLLLGIADFALLLLAAEAGWRIKLWQIGSLPDPIWTRLPQLLSFAVALECALIAVGAYGDEALQSLRFAAARLLVAVSLGVILISLMFFLFPELTLWRSNSAYAMGLSIALLILVRAAVRPAARRRIVQAARAGARRGRARIADHGARQAARLGLRRRRLCRDERGAAARSPRRSTAARSRASAIMSSAWARARWCWRSTSGATRCRSRICCGSRPPASTSTRSRPSSNARPAASISTASTRRG